MANGSFPRSLQESLPCSRAISKETSAGVRAFSSNSLLTASNLQKNGTSYAVVRVRKIERGRFRESWRETERVRKREREREKIRKRERKRERERERETDRGM